MRKKRPDRPDPELERAKEALAEAKQEKREAEDQLGFVRSLRAGWRRVHQRNHLAGLIDNEFRRT